MYLVFISVILLFGTGSSEDSYDIGSGSGEHINTVTTAPKIRTTPVISRLLKPEVCPWLCEITSPASSCGREWQKPPLRIKKIAGGFKSKRNSWPWMAALWKDGKLLCGATLICRGWVITAAHCFLDPNAGKVSLGEGMFIYLGRYLKNGNHKTVRKIEVITENVKIHPGYDIVRRIHDIALIRLPKPMNLSRKIRPICLPQFGRRAPKAGTNCRVAGWGETMGIGPSNHRLKEAILPIVSNNICKLAYYFSQTQLILCAGGQQGHDTCRGDSGGPLVCESDVTPGQWQIQGVVSYGSKACGTKDRPAIYTQISYYLFWIYGMFARECQTWRNESL